MTGTEVQLARLHARGQGNRFQDYTELAKQFYSGHGVFQNECIPRWAIPDINSMYPSILSNNTVISKEDYERHILGIFDEGGEEDMSSMCRNEYGEYEESKDIHFLFETEKWNGTRIENMESSHIINTLLMLNRRANQFKLNYELFVIDHSKDKLLVPRDNIDELAKKCPIEWITGTPIYLALIAELDKRGLLNYYNTVQERIAVSTEKDGE